MNRTQWQNRIEISPELHAGEPCIKGTRIPVRIIIGSMADGMEEEEIIKSYPSLCIEDIKAALAYAAEALHTEILTPLK